MKVKWNLKYVVSLDTYRLFQSLEKMIKISEGALRYIFFAQILGEFNIHIFIKSEKIGATSILKLPLLAAF